MWKCIIVAVLQIQNWIANGAVLVFTSKIVFLKKMTNVKPNCPSKEHLIYIPATEQAMWSKSTQPARSWCEKHKELLCLHCARHHLHFGCVLMCIESYLKLENEKKRRLEDKEERGKKKLKLVISDSESDNSTTSENQSQSEVEIRNKLNFLVERTPVRRTPSPDVFD